MPGRVDAQSARRVEAVLGALYVDQGPGAVQAYLEPLLPDEVARILLEERDRDARSTLQEWSQAERSITPRYRAVAEEGPDHAKWFTVEVRIRDEIVGRGTGLSQQAATQAAASDALRRLNVEKLSAASCIRIGHPSEYQVY